MSVNHTTDPERELFGQGLANLAAPVFGGVPATGAIARTAVNVRAGASSKLSAVVHAVVLAVIALVAGPLVGLIPLAALAGVLFATAVQMIESASLLPLRASTRGDAAVLVLTFTVTVAVDLVTAVAVGVGVAVVLALRAVAASASLDEVPLETGDHSAQERALLSEHIVAYRLDGPLVFAAAHRFLLELSDVARRPCRDPAHVAGLDDGRDRGARARRRHPAPRAARHRRAALGRQRRARGRALGAGRRGRSAPPGPAVRRDARGDRARAGDRPPARRNRARVGAPAVA